MTVSVLILTLNEEINISACMDSLSWCNDIVVLDSISNDRTVEIATIKGARVVERKFDNWSSHQNWAVNNIEFRHPWVFYMDADERCTGELACEIRQITGNAENNGNICAYRIRRRDFYMGTWLKRAQLYPTWIIRLFRHDKIHYERLVNPVAVVDGDIGELEGHIDHYPFSHGVSHWFDRHNRYSSMEAEELLRSREEDSVKIMECFATDPNLRRSMLKNIFFRLPGRPFIKFLYYYLIRRGFLDGKAGLTYSALQSIYEYMISVKVDEKKRLERNLPL